MGCISVDLRGLFSLRCCKGAGASSKAEGENLFPRHTITAHDTFLHLCKPASTPASPHTIEFQLKIFSRISCKSLTVRSSETAAEWGVERGKVSKKQFWDRLSGSLAHNFFFTQRTFIRSDLGLTDEAEKLFQ